MLRSGPQGISPDGGHDYAYRPEQNHRADHRRQSARDESRETVRHPDQSERIFKEVNQHERRWWNQHEHPPARLGTGRERAIDQGYADAEPKARIGWYEERAIDEQIWPAT